MLIDGTQLAPDTVIRTDVCVVGAGPAGITLARELLSSGVRLVVLESGDVEPTTEANDLTDMEFSSPDFPSPHGTCHRQFGGMAAIWTSKLLDGARGARLLPLDPIDFERRHWVPHSGWPFDYDAMAAYYERARARCGIAPFEFTAPIGRQGNLAPLTTPSGALLTRLDELGSTSVFTTAALVEIGRGDEVSVITNANVATVTANQATASAVVNCRGGPGFTVAARRLVLAAGAIENARILLNSTSDQPDGLGNGHDNVGRFYMDHPRVSFGYGRLKAAGQATVMARYGPHIENGQEFLGKFTLSDETLRREQLLNGNVRTFPHVLSVEQMGGVRSARRAIDALRHRRNLTGVPRDIAITARHAVPVARAVLSARRASRQADDSEDAGWAAATAPNARSFKVNYQPEQAPNRVNRVTLGQRTDVFGLRLPHLAWRWSDLDVTSMERARQIVAAELEAAGLGTLEAPDAGHEPIGELNGPPTSAHHHMGTTRMHDDPRHGVVDRNCRLHGVPTVFVAGASVFPTGGYANPTLTSVALAIRLADHLALQIVERRPP